MGRCFSEMIKVEELGGLLKRIGNYNPKSFEYSFKDRLILQKTVYLLQAFGLYLGYHFNWYLRGPYSITLARHGYELVDIYDRLPSAAFADENAEKRFNSFLLFMSEIKEDAEMLELLASLHFLRKRYPNFKKEELFNELSRKVFVSRDKFEKAFHILREYKLIQQ